MKALVTGASGFLGRHLCPELERRGWEVVCIHRNKPLNIGFSEYDIIFHLAAATQAGDYCLYHSGEQWIQNQNINTRALSMWQDHSPHAKLITIGSSCAYAPGSNLKEENYMSGEPHDSLYTYAMTKRMLYQGCRALNRQFGMNYLYLVPSTLYGPNYHTDGRQAHFIFDLIRKIIRGKELNEKVTLWGTGNQVREVIYIDDFIKLMLQLNDKVENDIFNVGCGESRTIKSFANEICKIAQYDPDDIVYDFTKYSGAGEKTLNTDKMEKVLGVQTKPSLHGGLKSTVDWYYESGAWK